MLRNLAATLLLVLLLPAACGPLPRPFQPDDKLADPNPLMVPGPDTGVTVVPVQGAPAATGRELSRLVAEGLRQLDIPATTRTAHAGSYVLQGQASLHPATETEDEVELRWQLIDPNGLKGSRLVQHERINRLAWSLPGSPDIAGLARRATPKLERLIRGGPDATDRSPPRLYIAVIAGAPGDGATRLRAAMSTILRRHGIQVIDAADPGSYSLHGAVKLQDEGAKQVVEIDWRLNGPDGNKLGTVGQRNAVPRGSLDGPWGDVAYAAAQGGADGVLQILRGGAGQGPSSPGQ